MQRKAFLTVITALLVACGGGEVVAILGALGAGGGDWLVDADPNAAGYQPRANCGPGANDLCTINVNPGELYRRDYAITGGGTMPGCTTANLTGTVTDAVNVSLPGCFVGRLLSVNEALSSDGRIRAYFDFFPNMTTGVWVDIQDDGHRFVFTSGSAGCEIAGSTRRALTLTIQASNFRQFADGSATTLVSRTSVTALTVAGAPARTFAGEFVGASGLRLTRSGETIELQRRDLVGSCS